MDETYSADDGFVEKVHACLADALRRSRPDPFGSPVTVAEIYQDLVPYRRIRTAVGFQMNADYEHTLLRLLAGEGGYARLEPSEARDELRAELAMPNPNVGLFRKYAACDVWITPTEVAPPLVQSEAIVVDAGTMPAAAMTPGAPRSSPDASIPSLPWEAVPVPPDEWGEAAPELLLEEEVDAADPLSSPEPVAALSVEPGGAPTMLESKPMTVPVADRLASDRCAFCDSALPRGRVVRFCPHCGTDQRFRPCVSCAEKLDPEWRFCITCGASQS